MSDKAAAEGNINKVNFYHFWPPVIFMFIISAVPVTLAAYYGSSFVVVAIDKLAGKPLEILSLIGGILPALGIALNLLAMNGKGTLIFFLFGFLLASYSSMSVITVSLFAIIVAYMFTVLYLKNENEKS
ncbi:PTS sugar transporter subunit IIC [Acerihabitans sp. KWT182]|uniref:PTS sugar transporter subunit IIC n=1 Tax=Acerihabitans sp. KWT182 TaxID=3157919 RepID=A0AAU7QB55_9GAMM